MKEKIYDFLLLWVTISSLFFIIAYATKFIDVVTLGGLFAGSFIVGLFIYVGLLLRRLVVGGPVREGANVNLIRLGESWLCMAAFCHEAVLMTTRILPGWTYDINLANMLFNLLIFPLFLTFLDEYVRGMKK